MYLKTIKLAGFKSFVDPTLIPILGPINAILGPNGCGKSNVVDAIRWVIGESSAKQLRGQSMSDVIFNGTRSRKPVGKASVELHFDNSDGRVVWGAAYAQYPEIAIRREVERDGRSNYFINGRHVRRREVVNIFLGTGLGTRSYAIIEQGMISNLVEAKPEELRAYIEETAGISKYKERRRETENRICHTQQNLARVKDICKELAKQVYHLKRQVNAVECYKLYKKEERLLSAQIKALQWKRLNRKILEFDQMINGQHISQKEKQSNQDRIEIAIVKRRAQLTELNKKHQGVQKQYYKLEADIARLEERIKDTQEKNQQWQIEFKENKGVWEILRNNTVACEEQITELEEELERLKSQSSTIKTITITVSEALVEVEANMNQWQEIWETFQSETSQITSQFEVICTKKEHYEKQLTELVKCCQQFQENLSQLHLKELYNEISSLEDHSAILSNNLKETQAQLQNFANKILFQREANKLLHVELQISHQALQTMEARITSLEDLQKSVLGNTSETVNTWLFRQSLTERPRLGQNLTVNSGWEVAVETVLGRYFDTICVDSLEAFISPMSELSGGRLTLIDRSAISVEPCQDNKETLSSQINSDWPFQHWLWGVYIAHSLEEAQQLQPLLKHNESVITREGIWLGPNWIHISKIRDTQNGFLVREQELKKLKSDIIEQQKKCKDQAVLLKAGEQKLIQQEADRESLVWFYQELSSEVTTIQTTLSTKRARLEDAKQQKLHLKEWLSDYRQKIREYQKELEIIKTKAHSLNYAKQQLIIRREELLQERDYHKQVLVKCREEDYQKRKELDALELRLASTEDQLNLLKQSIVRDQRQLKQLTERQETLSQYLSEGAKSLEALNQELRIQLDQQLTMQKKIHKVEENLKKNNHILHHLESERSATQKVLNEVQAQLEECRMQRQIVSVRQITLQEQLNENKFNYEQLIRELPEEATINIWQKKLDDVVERIQRIGPINLAAIEEYENINERKNYLDKQHADLTEALKILKNAMHKIDREIQAKFQETYDRVNKEFQLLFQQIFGGGRAALEMIDTNLLSTGVIVRAQPPGKRNVTIYMLSGGEKALTAVALVFSLFQLNPAPFCILDEVDAPLDDINVGRFCQLVKKMSKEVQFLLISHNKLTIEMADYLMGVTMQDPGISRIVAVDIKKAIQMVEEVGLEG